LIKHSRFFNWLFVVRNDIFHILFFKLWFFYLAICTKSFKLIFFFHGWSKLWVGTTRVRIAICIRNTGNKYEIQTLSSYLVYFNFELNWSFYHRSNENLHICDSFSQLVLICQFLILSVILCCWCSLNAFQSWQAQPQKDHSLMFVNSTQKWMSCKYQDPIIYAFLQGLFSVFITPMNSFRACTWLSLQAFSWWWPRFLYLIRWDLW